MTKDILVSRAKSLIVKGKLDETIKLLQEHQALISESSNKELSQLSGRYYDFKNVYMRGEMYSQEYDVRQNRIISQTLGLLENIEKETLAKQNDLQSNKQNKKWILLLLSGILIVFVLSFGYYYKQQQLIEIQCMIVDHNGDLVDLNQGRLKVYYKDTFLESSIAKGRAKFTDFPSSTLHFEFQLQTAKCYSLERGQKFIKGENGIVRLIVRDTCSEIRNGSPVINVEGDKNMINTFGDSSTVHISITNE